MYKDDSDEWQAITSTTNVDCEDSVSVDYFQKQKEKKKPTNEVGSICMKSWRNCKRGSSTTQRSRQLTTTMCGLVNIPSMWLQSLRNFTGLKMIRCAPLLAVVKKKNSGERRLAVANPLMDRDATWPSHQREQKWITCGLVASSKQQQRLPTPPLNKWISGNAAAAWRQLQPLTANWLWIIQQVCRISGTARFSCRLTHC